MIQPKYRLLVYGTTLAFCYPFANQCLYPRVPASYKSTNRTIIVTGATSRLGSAITTDLATRKMRVVMACRDMDKCRTVRREIVLMTGNHKLVCRHLDLEDLDSIDKFVEDISKSEPHIDVLVNNAAVRQLPERQLTKYGIERHFFVNFLAPFLLSSKLMDKLKESAAITRDSRIVNIIGNPSRKWNIDLKDINFDERPYNKHQAYNQSKLALAYFTILLDKINREQKNCIYVNGSNPARSQFANLLEHPVTLWEYIPCSIASYLYPQPINVVQPTIYCALSPKATEPGRSGKLYGLFNSRWSWGKASKDELEAKKVWNMATEKLAELQAAGEAAANKRKEGDCNSSGNSNHQISNNTGAPN